MIRKKLKKGCIIKDGKVICFKKKRSKAVSRNKPFSTKTHLRAKTNASC